MSIESNLISYTTDEDSSDDEFLLMDDLEEEHEDLVQLNFFIANERTIVDRTPCRTSMLTGKMFTLEVVNGHPTVCYELFRMHKHVFLNFCDTLKGKELLKDGKKVSVEEGVSMFLKIIGHTSRYIDIADHFQHSTYTVCKWFKRVLRAVCSLGTEIIRPTNQNNIHPHLRQRYYPYFKDCIGAIDGTHIAAYAPASRQTSFCGRKTQITQNVMLACDFDMKFTFVYCGWEGTANDSRVFINAVTRTSNNFPMPCGDQFYLVDAGYPNMPGFLAPYRGQRYHLRDYSGQGAPRGKEELFNYRHSSCRNIIERCIGVLKTRFPILKLMPNYPLSRQRLIPTACCTVHNFIRQEHALDVLFTQYSSEHMIFEDVQETSQNQEVIPFDASQTARMGEIRDRIATQMWNDYLATHT